MYTKLNNVLLAVFLIIGAIELFLVKRAPNPIKLLIIGMPVYIFFFLAILAAFRHFDLKALKLLENHWSLLFVPLIILMRREDYVIKRNLIFVCLMFGSILTLLICNVYHISKMLKDKTGLMEWFTSGYFGLEFTRIADTHPTYLSLFIITSILFLIQNRQFSNLFKAPILILLFFGLFQLTSKMALLLFLLFFFYVIIHSLKRQSEQSIILVLGLLFCTFIFYVFGNKYMKSSMYFVNSVLDEKRIERWEISYEIFRENPIIGVGYRKIDDIRKTKYLKNGYSLAAANDLNAHNQFLEYLSINGFTGGFLYAVSIGFLFFLSVQRRDYLFAFVFLAFILANMTESMMVRIKGIEYYAIFASLFLCSKETRTGLVLKK